jgi:hypothetical protein
MVYAGGDYLTVLKPGACPPRNPTFTMFKRHLHTAGEVGVTLTVFRTDIIQYFSFPVYFEILLFRLTLYILSRLMDSD